MDEEKHYDVRIRTDVTDDDGTEIASLDRAYVIKNPTSIEACFEHATKTAGLLMEGVGLETGFEKAND